MRACSRNATSGLLGSTAVIAAPDNRIRQSAAAAVARQALQHINIAAALPVAVRVLYWDTGAMPAAGERSRVTAFVPEAAVFDVH
jgi:hypothetical protein